MRLKYRLVLFLALAAGVFHAVAGNDGPLKLGQNFRIYPGNVAQTEVFLVKSPLDQNVMFAGCNTINFVPFFISEGIYSTSDGGATWRGSDTCSGAPINFHGGDPGIAIDRNGTFILTRLGREPFVGLYSHYSYDQGVTWSAQKVISTDDLERAALATDANPASTYYGRTYAAWVKFATPFPVMLSYTDNGAQSWVVQKQVNNPTTRSGGGDLAVGPNGEVYACWAGVTDVSPFKEVQVGFASSLNGGAEWHVTENAFAVNGITGILANKSNIRVNGLPSIAVDTTHGPHRGWIYIVTGQKGLAPAGNDPDIILNRSTDGGQTWSAGIRVNHDALNNGKTQYFPNLHVDKYGALNIIFYDDRTTTTDSTGVFLARSSDGGDTWKEYEISDHHFKPAPIGGLGQGYQGDIIDLTSNDTRLWTVWMDNSSGVYQVWADPIDFSAINGTGDQEGRTTAALQQNLPNPFSVFTTIPYSVKSAGNVTLQVFDLYGRLVAEPVNGFKAPGEYVTTVSAAELPAGTCFYRLTSGSGVETRKMIVVK